MEVELKLPLDAQGLARLRRHLQDRGTFAADETQVDTYYAHPCRDLVATDEALRLREARGRLELTYKGPRQGSGVKARPETNLAVDGAARGLLEALGFVPVARLTKQRQTWRLGSVEVALDHVAGLGWFVELEAEEGPPDAEAAILAACRSLGLDSSGSLRQSYLGLALEAGADGVQRLS